MWHQWWDNITSRRSRCLKSRDVNIQKYKLPPQIRMNGTLQHHLLKQEGARGKGRWNNLPPHCPSGGQPKQNPTQRCARPPSNCKVPIRDGMFRHAHDRNGRPVHPFHTQSWGHRSLPEAMSCNSLFSYFLKWCHTLMSQAALTEFAVSIRSRQLS